MSEKTELFGELRLYHHFPDSLVISLAPLTINVTGVKLTPEEITELSQQVSTAVEAALAAQLAPITGALKDMKQSIADEIAAIIKDEATADQVNQGIASLQSQIADVDSQLVKLQAADDSTDIAALSAERQRLSARLAAGLVAIHPALTTVPPVIVDPTVPVPDPNAPPVSGATTGAAGSTPSNAAPPAPTGSTAGAGVTGPTNPATTSDPGAGQTAGLQGGLATDPGPAVPAVGKGTSTTGQTGV